MQKSVFNVIEPLSISYRQLKALTNSTVGKQLPEASMLIARKDDILFIYENGDVVLTVFRDGFCLYQNADEMVVFAVDRCRNLIFMNMDGESIRVEESTYSPGPCLIPLLVKGNGRADSSFEDYERFWQEFTET